LDHDSPADCRRGSSAELAALALAGHASAWGELVRRHTHRVVLSLLARGVTLDVAEDLAQETWARLLQQQRAGRLNRLELPGLAVTQARWLAREAERTSARRVALAGRAATLEVEAGEPADDDPASDPERGAVQREQLEIVRREIARCPARAREVFRAVYAERAPSHAEVARDLGLSVQRVRQILCEVRARVRAAIRELERKDERWNT
jgi:RNA polymerase sigma-70 factor (ECF subfamily)